jgi:hypothetical protein
MSFSLKFIRAFSFVPNDVIDIITGFSDVCIIQGIFKMSLSQNHQFHKTWSMAYFRGGDSGEKQLQMMQSDGLILSSYSTGNVDIFRNEKLFNIVSLSNPCHVTVANSVVYVADWFSHVVRLYTLPTGGFIRNIGENNLSFPSGVAVSSTSGEIFVSEFGNHRITVFSETGVIRRQWGKFGHDAGEFHFPKHVVHNRDKIYVVDFYNNRIQVFLDSGEFLFAFGDKHLNEPTCLAISAFNEIIVTEKENKRIRICDEHGLLLRSFRTVTKPVCIAVDRFGHLLVNSFKNILVYE